MDNSLTIICPKCKNTIALDEVLSHEVEDKYKLQYEQKLNNEKNKLEEMAFAKAEKKIKQMLELDIKNTHDELSEQKVRNQRLLDQLTSLNKTIRELKVKDEEREFATEKYLSEQLDKIKNDVTQKASEENLMKLAEKDKQLQNALKEAEELKRKLQQGSQQNQGEVLELELEKILKSEFPNDKITPVGKGIRGADIIQEVWDRTGVKCGTLLWESKNAKWNENWIDKLKDDQRNLKAEIAVIISENLPADIKSAAYRNNIWIAHRSFAVGIAMALRANLIQASFIRRSMKGKDEKKEILWNYLTGTEFTQRMEAILEAFTTMKFELEKEKQAYTKIWAKREMQIQRVLNTTIGLRGDLEGVTGNALPPIKNLELPDKE